MADHRGALALEDIVVVPRNGYVNRLQAWASAYGLAGVLDASLHVCWEPEPIAPVTPDELFAQDRTGFDFLPPSDLRDRLECTHEQLPRYLNVDEERRLVVLAGHDRGEQVFMDQLLPALQHPCRPTTLLIIAGGHFHLPSVTRPRRPEDERRDFYRQLPWSDAVQSRTETVLGDHVDFVGLHVRQTDRSIAAPPRRAIREAIRSVSHSTGMTSVFVAADTATARERWLAEIRDLGLHGWSAPDPELDRYTAQAGLDAMIDWRILGRARGIAYSRESSFGHEAAVAADVVQTSVALAASERLQLLRRAADFGRSVVTYPRRHFAQGRNPL